MIYTEQSRRDKIMSDLESCGGRTSRSIIARRTKLKQAELDSILEELEHEGMIQRTRLRTDRRKSLGEMISLKWR